MNHDRNTYLRACLSIMLGIYYKHFKMSPQSAINVIRLAYRWCIEEDANLLSRVSFIAGDIVNLISTNERSPSSFVEIMIASVSDSNDPTEEELDISYVKFLALWDGFLEALTRQSPELGKMLSVRKEEVSFNARSEDVIALLSRIAYPYAGMVKSYDKDDFIVNFVLILMMAGSEEDSGIFFTLLMSIVSNMSSGSENNVRLSSLVEAVRTSENGDKELKLSEIVIRLKNMLEDEFAENSSPEEEEKLFVFMGKRPEA